MIDYSYVSNSSPLIAFIKKKELNLLRTLFKKIIIPEAVYEELTEKPKKQEEQVKLLKDAIKNGWIIVKKLKTLKIPDLNLGNGEKEAINLCFEVENPILLIDEKKGSSIAKAFKILTLGTLGILILLKKKGSKTKEELLDNLDILIRKNFYLSSDVITMFLKEIEP